MNNFLTRRVVELHQQGYCCDFIVLRDRRFFCVQHNLVHDKGLIRIELVDIAYDKLHRQYKYLYSIDTCSGERGILLLNFLYFPS